jgi:hypothetical protein
MNGHRSVMLKVDGKSASIVATEAPNRWTWILRVEGEDLVNSESAHPSGQMAMNEALDWCGNVCAQVPRFVASLLNQAL